jgi:hypothetical protein
MERGKFVKLPGDGERRNIFDWEIKKCHRQIIQRNVKK